MNLQILYVWVNGGLYDANSSTYSVLWTPPVLAWLKTCVSALGFNMINDDFRTDCRWWGCFFYFYFPMSSHMISFYTVVSCFSIGLLQGRELWITSVKTRQSDDGREKESIRGLCGIQNFPGIKWHRWPPDFTACFRHVLGPGQPARCRSHLA